MVEELKTIEAAAEAREPGNMGLNIRIAREYNKMPRKELAEGIHISDSTLVRYEKKRIVPEDILNRVASFLKCDINFLKYHDLEQEINTYKVENNTFNNTNSESSEGFSPIQGNATGEIIQELHNTGIPIEEYKALTKEITKLTVDLAISETRKEDQKEEIEKLKQQINELETKIKELESK